MHSTCLKDDRIYILTVHISYVYHGISFVFTLPEAEGPPILLRKESIFDPGPNGPAPGGPPGAPPAPPGPPPPRRAAIMSIPPGGPPPGGPEDGGRVEGCIRARGKRIRENKYDVAETTNKRSRRNAYNKIHM
mgnify:FL=1